MGISTPRPFALLTCAILVVACSADSGGDTEAAPSTQWTSDFEPPAGAGETPAGVPDDGGPWNRRLLLATSPDGLTWTRSDRVLANQADAQSMVIGPDGAIFVYYLTNYEPYRDQLVVAVSPDEGATWVHKTLDFQYADGVVKGADPAMIRLDDGRLRMYFSAHGPTGVQTRSAVSADGLSFVQEDGIRHESPTEGIVAPSVIRGADGYHLFWVSKEGKNGHATSPDGMTFTDTGATADLGPGIFIAESGLAYEDGYRMFAFSGPDGGHDLYFAHSPDGTNWTLEPAPLIDKTDDPLHRGGIRGGTAVQLADGAYLMVYASYIPE